MATSILKKISGKKVEMPILNTEPDPMPTNNLFTLNDDDMAPIVDAIFEGYRKNNVPKFQTKKTFAPSTIVWNHGVCPRYWYLAFQGGTFFEYRTGKETTNMDHGTDRHARIQQAMEDAGILIEKEKETRLSDPPIFGYVDAFVKWTNNEYIVEIKTCNNEAFERHLRNETASSYHILQLLIYMKIYKKKRGIILYENKNTHDLLAIPVNINQAHVDFVDYLFDWLREVWSAWENKTIPQVPFKNNSIKLCMACPLRDACLVAPEGDIKIARRKDEKGLF